MFKYISYLITLTFVMSLNVNGDSVYETKISFHFWNLTGSQGVWNNNQTLLESCDPEANFTIIIHGWRENLDAPWLQTVVDAFLANRGGCVFYMDYSYYSFAWIGTLVKKFDPIMKVLLTKLRKLEELQFVPDNGYLFGFSFGTLLAFEAGYQFGRLRLYRIDGCDPMGPYYYSKTSPPVMHANESAQYVTCIHTSNDFGTSWRYCPIDINMGFCGDSQIAAWGSMTTSHQFCPIFYGNAFTHDFKLVEKPNYCVNDKYVPDVTSLPPMVMGYHMDVVNAPDGEYYSESGASSPYNVL